MKITEKLRKHVVAKGWAKADASDKDIQRIVGVKLLKGLIKPAELTELTKGAADTKKPKPPADPPKKKEKKKPGFNDDQLQAQINKGVADAMKAAGLDNVDKRINPTQVFAKATIVRVKEAVERYSDTKAAAVFPEFSGFGKKTGKHPFAGMPAKHGGAQLYHPSDRDKACAMAFFKHVGSAACKDAGVGVPRWLRMTEHDRELFQYSLRNHEWTGMLKGDDADAGAVPINRKRLTELQVKTILDDSTSGGIEIAPVVFDDAIIITPVLYGELFPFVNVVPIAKGRRIKGGAMVNPTFTSGVSEGTAIQPFNTSGFVSAFDTAIYSAVAGIELGLDFEEDSPVDLGAAILEQYGLKAMEWLDRVIAVGDGSTEPLGIFNATGTTVVNSDSGVGGPMTVSDYEGLMFALAKQFRTEGGAYCAFLSNDTMYRRCKGIPVGPTDERRVFGMTHGDYSVLEHPYKVQNNIGMGQIAFANLRRYRMYRRLGMTVRIETAGRQLALSNTKLIVVRMRFGGQPELGGAVAVMTDAQVV